MAVVRSSASRGKWRPVKRDSAADQERGDADRESQQPSLRAAQSCREGQPDDEQRDGDPHVPLCVEVTGEQPERKLALEAQRKAPWTF